MSLLRIFYYTIVTMAMTSSVLALEINPVVVDQQRVDPSKNEKLSIQFKLDEDASVVLNIYDEREYLVRRVDSGFVKKGTAIAQWDLKDSKGVPVPANIYHYTLSASNDAFDVQYDLTDITGKEMRFNIPVEWDEKSKKMSYALTAPAVIGIRAGLKESGPLLNTIVNWQPRYSGLHEEYWNGMDSSGVLDIGTHPHLVLMAEAYTLPDNTIFVESTTHKTLDVGKSMATAFQFTSNFEKDGNGNPIVRTQTVTSKKQMVVHFQQRVEDRGDFPVALSVAGKNAKQKDGATVVQGETGFLVDVDPSVLSRLIGQRFELCLYVDGQYHFENEVGFLPSTFKWNSVEYSEGVHYITVNIRGYEGNFGMATIKVYVKK